MGSNTDESPGRTSAPASMREHTDSWSCLGWAQCPASSASFLLPGFLRRSSSVDPQWQGVAEFRLLLPTLWAPVQWAPGQQLSRQREPVPRASEQWATGLWATAPWASGQAREAPTAIESQQNSACDKISYCTKSSPETSRSGQVWFPIRHGGNV